MLATLKAWVASYLATAAWVLVAASIGLVIFMSTKIHALKADLVTSSELAARLKDERNAARTLVSTQTASTAALEAYGKAQAARARALSGCLRPWQQRSPCRQLLAGCEPGVAWAAGAGTRATVLEGWAD